MKSPFPGMDPYLEQYWGDVHATLIVYMRDQINEQLPEGLQARVEESLMVDAEEYSRTVYPDVHVDERRTQRHIEIIDRNSGNRVVTAIELLSPANKRAESGRRAYREKQREYLQARVNLVEIDLIREGSFIVAVPEELVPHDYRTPYIICIRRAVRLAEAELIRVPLQEPLPNIRVPLRPGDPDLVLQLQPLLDECCRRGRYESLDYSRPLSPQLEAADQRWAEQLLKETRQAHRQPENS